MNIPSFTAEASLYKTSGHYRTGRGTVSFGNGGSAIHLAMDDEVIPVGDCGPGGLLWGDPANGEDWGCTYPLEGAGEGDDSTDVVPDGGRGPGRGGGGGG